MSGSILKSSRIKQNFEYDSWNRIRQMKYPDGEVLTYGYDAAGKLTSMVSKKDNTSYTLLEDMKYDQYGNIATKTYGNGTSSRYTYDAVGNVETKTMPNLAKIGNGGYIKYEYDYDRLGEVHYYPRQRYHRIQYTYVKSLVKRLINTTIPIIFFKMTCIRQNIAKLVQIMRIFL